MTTTTSWVRIQPLVYYLTLQSIFLCSEVRRSLTVSAYGAILSEDLGIKDFVTPLLKLLHGCQDVTQPSHLLPSLFVPTQVIPHTPFPFMTLMTPYDDMIFILMTHAWDYHHPFTITTLCPVFLTSLWEVPFGRWEVVFYLVWFASPCPLSLALETFPEEQDFL